MNHKSIVQSAVRAPITLRLQDRSPRQILEKREKSIMVESLVESRKKERSTVERKERQRFMVERRERERLSRSEVEDLVSISEQEMRRKLVYIESINCLTEGYSLDDLPRYLATLDLKKKVHRAVVSLQTSRLLEQEMEKQTATLEREILKEEEFLVTLREIQAESLVKLQSRFGF